MDKLKILLNVPEGTDDRRPLLYETLDEPKIEKHRVVALDALRGLAILLMMFFYLEPYDNPNLPAWMLPGFMSASVGMSWVDLIFPLFLVCVGVSIPLAFGAQMDAIETQYSMELDFYPSFDLNVLKNTELMTDIGWVALKLARRLFYLFIFALFSAHVTASLFAYPDQYKSNGFALLGFVFLFGIFMVFENEWKWEWFHNVWVRLGVRVAGWIGIILLATLTLHLPFTLDGTEHFSFYRADQFLLIILNCWLVSAVVWMIGQTNANIRYWVIGLVTALRLSANYPNNLVDYNTPNWIQHAWNNSPIPWLTKMEFFEFLCIVLPATEIGDILYSTVKQSSSEENQKATKRSWPLWRFIVLAVIMLGLGIVILVGFSPSTNPADQLLWTTLTSAGLCFVAWILLRWPAASVEFVIHDLFHQAMPWFWLGMFSEPYLTGIDSLPSTPSYYFVSFSICVFLLIFFFIIADALDLSIALKPLIWNGQNSLLAYGALFGLLMPLLVLFHIQGPVSNISNAGLACFIALVFTSILMALVSLATWLRIFWKV